MYDGPLVPFPIYGVATARPETDDLAVEHSTLQSHGVRDLLGQQRELRELVTSAGHSPM